MPRGHLVIETARIAQEAYRLYFRGGGSGVCETGLLDRGKNMRPAWHAVLQELYFAEKELFESSGASGDIHDPDIPWEDNKGGYANWKSRNFGGGPNILTGRLKGQLSGENPSDPPYIRATDTSFEFGSNAPTEEWSGRQVWYGDGRVLDGRPEDEMISADGPGEDVGGILQQGGWFFWGRERLYDKAHDEYAGPTFRRPIISLGYDAMNCIVETVLDWITLAPIIRGWYNPGRREWVPEFRRNAGSTRVRESGRTRRVSRSGRDRVTGRYE